ncbi:AraC family transcriptional regulator [Bradyrhizobium brasilense]|uniref:AraC family transcriptional regulator n=1 Tax=Bradyrhizobium brasilense TaxID=1419277 RepID=UPI0028772784|nr:AraC family transcriptional regulator [Bradyrhizobium brasilense]MCP3413873.1 AraC family transcriptional regulator [Bradyrhizobium brasilense]
MQGQTQGNLKYPESTLLKSSDGLGWSTISADLRTHRSWQGQPTALASHVEVTVAVRGSDEAVATCKVAGKWHPVPLQTGTIWLNPVGAKADEIRISASEVRALHLYVPTSAFARLSHDYNLPLLPGNSVRYSSGVQDEVIRQIGLSMLSEMECPTAAGRMLAETSSLFLAARLMQAHAESMIAGGVSVSAQRLENGRLKRVLAYVEEHIDDDVTVTELADVACLSVFHFTRAFAAAMGVPPHRYVSQRRLEAAKALLAMNRSSLSEIALKSRFSSQSSFTRAFKRATGVTPAEYRQMAR